MSLCCKLRARIGWAEWNGPCLNRPVPPSRMPLPPSPPTLTVITPAYNVEPYLARCIESVLGQSLTDLEMIVVDDGSTDGTADVIAHYAARDERVRGFRGPNRGVSHARNVALQDAHGRYIALLDGDDEWEPAFANTLVRQLERQKEFAIVCGNGLNLGGPLDGRPVKPWPAPAREIRMIDLIEHEDAMFIMSIFRREVYEALGGFNESLSRSEDYEFWMRAAAAGFRIVTCPEPLSRYRRRSDSMSADQSAMFDSIITVLKQARGFRHRARTEELAAIDRKLDALSSARLLSLGKMALMRRNYAEARSHFWELYRRGNGLPFAAASLGLRIAPALAMPLYRAQLWLKGRLAEELERRRRTSAPVQAGVESSSGSEVTSAVVSRPAR